MAKPTVHIHWFRRDLRLDDNASLYYALRSNIPVQCVFIFDTTILNQLTDKADKRVSFIYAQISALKAELEQRGATLVVKYGNPVEVWRNLMAEYEIKQVFANHDYEPAAVSRDKQVKEMLASHGIVFSTFKDQCILEKNEVLKDDGQPYTVFTPYKRKWLSVLSAFHLTSYPTRKYIHHLLQCLPANLPRIEDLGFQLSTYEAAPKTLNINLIRQYAQNRDYPAIEGTSKLSVHLRFGTISIRELAAVAKQHSDTWLSELIWRDFYMMILWHFPYVTQGAFKPIYNQIAWRNNEEEFQRWCEGQTGYPIVDAGMRELNTTGFMHNRVRMIVASFLTKHLLVDWRWGEAYFASKLLDFDLSANNGGWQWAAGSGCDAAPYFRIFNPYEQTKKFDGQMQYICRWVPEFQSFTYPAPIVEHAFARERCLKTYKEALAKGG